MLSYNHHPHRSNSTLLEVHRGDGNTLDIFLKQYSNKVREVKKKKFNAGDTVRINRPAIVFEKGNYFMVQ